ncbi:MAG: SDR family NAD(P)-dependent oxidoreductase [Flavobacteriales bacterium]|nr:SDR family NAD(P)-dependent oxidoreductase [Flavobacteriales bacterium]
MNYYFITGASKGLGRAIADILLKDSSNFVFGYSRTSTITHQQYYHKNIDFSNIELVQKIKFPELKNAEQLILINNAGVISETKHFGNMNSKKIIEGYTVNLIAPSILCNEFIQCYKTYNCSKKIINISSGAAQSPIDGWGVYCASKAGIDMMSKVLAEENKIGKTNFQFLSIAPGIIDTEMQQQIRKSDVSNFSNLNRFVDYKTTNSLETPEKTAKNVLQLINDSKQFSKVVCSVKDLTE